MSRKALLGASEGTMSRIFTILICASITAGCGTLPRSASATDKQLTALLDSIVNDRAVPIRKLIESRPELINRWRRGGFRQWQKDISPWLLAVRTQKHDVIRAFIDAGAHVDQCVPADLLLLDMSAGMTALHFAARTGDVRSLKLLLEGGANIHAKDALGSSPLHHCRGVPAAQVLLDYGADVNASNSCGHTPIHLVDAYFVGVDEPSDSEGLENEAKNLDSHVTTKGLCVNLKLAKYLHTKGAQFTKDSLGRSPIDLAAQFGHKELAVELQKLKLRQ